MAMTRVDYTFIWFLDMFHERTPGKREKRVKNKIDVDTIIGKAIV